MRNFFTLGMMFTLLLSIGSSTQAQQETLRVGSKSFVESMILGEIVCHLGSAVEVPYSHRSGLGGTGFLWEALRQGELDVYPDYTGTLIQELFADRKIQSQAELEAVLAESGIKMSRPLGFTNNYGIGMLESTAVAHNITKISDLSKPENATLKFGVSHEFYIRGDGWSGLRNHYQLPQQKPSTVTHEIGYSSLKAGSIQVMEVYTTDAFINRFKLRILQDDRKFFTTYDAILLYRADLEQRIPEIIPQFKRLEGSISEAQMIEMNGAVQVDKEKHQEKRPIFNIAQDFVKSLYLEDWAKQVALVGVSPQSGAAQFGAAITATSLPLPAQLAVIDSLTGSSAFQTFMDNTWTHLYMVSISLLCAVVISLPLGITAAHQPKFGQLILGIVGIFQTIPSMALFMFLIALGLPLGARPTIIALFLYSLLPIVRNTYTGIHDIPGPIRESAEALGLSKWAKLRLIELPLASRSILAGIKTSAVINVGTATIGAIVGAGGYGRPIMQGMTQLDIPLILFQGAIPAAVLALLVQGLFEIAERYLVPLGLRIKGSH